MVTAMEHTFLARVRARYRDFQKFAVTAVTFVVNYLVSSVINRQETRFCCHHSETCILSSLSH